MYVFLKIHQVPDWYIFPAYMVTKHKNENQNQKAKAYEEFLRACLVHLCLFSHFLRECQDAPSQEYASQTTKFLQEQSDTEL